MHSLGGPCGDIHLGHFKKTLIELNWIELNIRITFIKSRIHTRIQATIMKSLLKRLKTSHDHNANDVITINILNLSFGQYIQINCSTRPPAQEHEFILQSLHFFLGIRLRPSTSFWRPESYNMFY